jgi:hypothetical protein
VRHRDGIVTIFTVPGASETYPWAINSKGEITGFAATVPQAFVRSASGHITTFAVDGYQAFPYAINMGGVVVGKYYDDQNNTHGFIRTP